MDSPKLTQKQSVIENGQVRVRRGRRQGNEAVVTIRVWRRGRDERLSVAVVAVETRVMDKDKKRHEAEMAGPGVWMKGADACGATSVALRFQLWRKNKAR